MPNRDPATGRFVSSGGSGGGTNLGTAFASIVIKTDGIDAAIRSAKNTIDGGLTSIGSSISNIGDGFSNLGSSLTTLTAPILAFGATGIKSAADFEVLMKQIEVFGGLAPDQLETVRQYALKMGADTKFSSSQAADAMLELLKSGQSVTEAMATLPTVLELAAAGNIGLAEASGIVSSGLAIYKLKAEDASRVSNALAKAANASRADVRDLGQALTNAGPVAAQFGLSIEDTAAVLAVFSNNGLSGAEAGTQLKSVLLNLNRPTEDVQGALKKLGVSLYDNRGKTRDFNTVIKELDAALDKLPVEEQNQLMQTLGGSYGIVGLSALRAAGGLDSMRAQMESAPTAADVASQFMDTFAGKVESLTGSIETLQIEALTPLMDEYLAPLVDQIIGVVNSITEWVQANPELAGQIISIVAVIAAGAPIIWGVGTAISAVGGLMSSLGTIIGFVLSPIGLLIAALVGLYIAFQNNFLGIRDFLQPVVDKFNEMGGIPGILDSASTSAQQLLTLAITPLQDPIQKVVDKFNEMGGIPGILDSASTSAQQLSQMGLFILVDTLNKASTSAGQLVAIIQDWIGKNSDLLQHVVNLVGAFFAAQGLISAWNTVSTAITAAKAAMEGAKLGLSGIMGAIQLSISPVVALTAAIWALVEAYQAIQKFQNTVQAGQQAVQQTLGPKIASGEITPQQYQDTAFKATAAEFGGGFGGDLAARILGQIPVLNNGINQAYDQNKAPNAPGTQFGINWNEGLIAPFVNTIMGGMPAAFQGQLYNLKNLFGIHDYPGPYSQDMAYMVGKGAQPEAFIPSTGGGGMAIPNFDKVMAGLAGGGQSGPVFKEGSIVINASTYEGGRAAGRGFKDELQDLLQARGNQ